jgi:hypothetical protein
VADVSSQILSIQTNPFGRAASRKSWTKISILSDEATVRRRVAGLADGIVPPGEREALMRRVYREGAIE